METRNSLYCKSQHDSINLVHSYIYNLKISNNTISVWSELPKETEKLYLTPLSLILMSIPVLNFLGKPEFVVYYSAVLGSTVQCSAIFRSLEPNCLHQEYQIQFYQNISLELSLNDTFCTVQSGRNSILFYQGIEK